nr:helix-turn-helix domain-containing protein [Paenibacillus ihuae]
MDVTSEKAPTNRLLPAIPGLASSAFPLLKHPSFRIEENSWLILVQNQQDCTPLTGQAGTLVKLEDTADLLETLRSFINHNCSVAQTSEALNLHRNTLQYRLKRIESLTGKDPRNLLFELTYSLLALYK